MTVMVTITPGIINKKVSLARYPAIKATRKTPKGVVILVVVGDANGERVPVVWVFVFLPGKHTITPQKTANK